MREIRERETDREDVLDSDDEVSWKGSCHGFTKLTIAWDSLEYTHF